MILLIPAWRAGGGTEVAKIHDVEYIQVGKNITVQDKTRRPDGEKAGF